MVERYPQLKTYKLKSNDSNIEFSYRVKRLYLTDIVKHKLINRSDIRSVRRWCRANRVEVLKDTSGEYVIEAEYNLAYNLPVLQKLKKQFADGWQTAYQHYLNDDIYMITTLDQIPISKGYKPRGSIGIKLKNK